MDDEQLQKLVERISIHFFQKPFKHKARFNPRLRTTGGRYLLHTHDIEINKKYYEQHGEKELIGIIKHELCHYHLHLEGRGFKHRDREFKELLARVDAPRHCTPLENENTDKTAKKHFYTCTKCHTLYERKRRIDTNRFVCGKCKGKLRKIHR